jgi:hypothetical protein
MHILSYCRVEQQPIPYKLHWGLQLQYNTVQYSTVYCILYILSYRIVSYRIVSTATAHTRSSLVPRWFQPSQAIPPTEIMVFPGALSRGCDRCRKRKIKVVLSFIFINLLFPSISIYLSHASRFSPHRMLTRLSLSVRWSTARMQTL